jgi:hypothetical protein
MPVPSDFLWQEERSRRRYFSNRDAFIEATGYAGADDGGAIDLFREWYSPDEGRGVQLPGNDFNFLGCVVGLEFLIDDGNGNLTERPPLFCRDCQRYSDIPDDGEYDDDEYDDEDLEPDDVAGAPDSPNGRA